MSNYLNNLRKQQAKHNLRKPKKVGEPEIRHTSKAHIATISDIDWRFETFRRGYGINDDGTVEVLK